MARTVIHNSSYHFLLQLLLLCISSVVTEKCTTKYSCTALMATCMRGLCECDNGYEGRESNGVLYCEYVSRNYLLLAFMPIVITIFISVVIAIIVYYILKRRRLSRAAHPTAWVHQPYVTMGVPVATQSYPAACPAQQYYQGPPPPYTNQGPNNQGHSNTSATMYPTQQYQQYPTMPNNNCTSFTNQGSNNQQPSNTAGAPEGQKGV